MTIRGRCPSVHDPMLSGDGWLVRVKPPAARLPAMAAAALAAASIAGGNGVVQVTQRGNWQFRGFSRESAATFAAVAVAHGVADRDGRVERNRRVIAAPLGSVALADEVEAFVGEFALADKFSVLVDDADRLRLEGCVADICVRVDGEKVRIALAGAGHGASCDRRDLLPTLARILQAFGDLADGEGRMHRLLDDCGEAMFFAAAGLQPVAVRAATTEDNFIGDLGGGVMGFALPYGQMRADVLAGLAEFSARHGDGFIRTTPLRTVMLAGIVPASVTATPHGWHPPPRPSPARGEGEEFFVWADGWGLITDPNDARLSITICPGRPACASGLADTRAIADLVARQKLRSVHVSGCSKGCAHPRPAAITIVGVADGLRVVRDGCATDGGCVRVASDIGAFLAGLAA